MLTESQTRIFDSHFIHAAAAAAVHFPSPEDGSF